MLLEQRISSMLRYGYIPRNPYPAPGQETYRWKTVNGLTILGTSGMGKTTAVNRVLGLYEPVIQHNVYHHSVYGDVAFPKEQIVWLKLNIGKDGSLKQLVEDFFRQIDTLLYTDYYNDYNAGRRSANALMFDMRTVAERHALGTLWIDEIQHANRAASGGDKQMLNFFVDIQNNLSIPIGLIGTPEAADILAGRLQRARRGSSEGEMIWDRMVLDPDSWGLFINGFWRYQYLRHFQPLTQDLSTIIYRLAGGITSLGPLIYKLAQRQAVREAETEDDEKLDPTIVWKAVESDLRSTSSLIRELTDGTPHLSAEDLMDIRPIQRINVTVTLAPVGAAATSQVPVAPAPTAPTAQSEPVQARPPRPRQHRLVPRHVAQPDKQEPRPVPQQESLLDRIAERAAATGLTFRQAGRDSRLNFDTTTLFDRERLAAQLKARPRLTPVRGKQVPTA